MNQIVDDDPTGHCKLTLLPIEGTASCILVRATGYIDSSNADYLYSVLSKIIGHGHYRIILSFNGLPTSRSSSLTGRMLDSRKLLKANGGDLIITEMSKNQLENLHLLGLEDALLYLPTEDEAVAYFTRRPNENTHR